MSKKSCVGIYFSDNFVNIVEQQDGKVFNFAKSPCILDNIQSGSGQTVAGEAKVANLIKDELLKNNIITRDVSLAFANKEIIVRFFDIPLVPRAEIESTVEFEAKRYIPFKLEEMVFDFQTKIDKKAKKIKVLFVGIKTEALDKYISILEQAGLRIVAIEPVFVGTLRALKALNKIDNKCLAAVVDVHSHLRQGNITVVEGLYPQFSRDLNLKLPSKEEGEGDPSSQDMLSKLINEIKVSLDYCRRRSSVRSIKVDKLILISTDDKGAWVESLHSALEVTVVPVRIHEGIVSEKEGFDLELSQAYGVALRDAISLPLAIDLFSRMKASSSQGDRPEEESTIRRINMQMDRGFIIKNIIVFFVLLALVHFWGVTQVRIYNNRLRQAKEKRHILSAVDTKTITYEKLKQLEKKYDKRISVLRDLVRNRVYFTPVLSAIAALRPRGLWLTDVEFRQEAGARELLLSGRVYLDDEQEEFSVVNGFLADLKRSENLSGFRAISLLSMSRDRVRGYDVAGFRIKCGSGGNKAR